MPVAARLLAVATLVDAAAGAVDLVKTLARSLLRLPVQNNVLWNSRKKKQRERERKEDSGNESAHLFRLNAQVEHGSNHKGV